MLISHPTLDSTFSNPVDSPLPYSPATTTATTTAGDSCFFPADEQALWLGHTPPPTEPHHRPDDSRTSPQDVFRISEGRPPSLESRLLHQLRDCLKDGKHREGKTAKPAEAMAAIEPEDDLRCLVNNDRKLELCGYYYGSLSWLDASHLLRQCSVGTFLVRDSEHSGYLYTLSVQTRKGPTSCRIDYSGGSFCLDCSKDLSRKMPRFDCVPHLVDFYSRLPRYLPNGKAVWLDMDESNSLDVPVQIYRPLYRQVRSLQHLCRVGLVQQQACRTMEPPSAALDRALGDDSRFKHLPNIIREYLRQYPYSQ